MFTVLLYLTEGTWSTSFPAFPLSDVAIPRYPLDDEEEEGNTAEEAAAAAAAKAALTKEQRDKQAAERAEARQGILATNHELVQQSIAKGVLCSKNYKRFRTLPGDMAMFSQLLLHGGSVDDLMYDRSLIFSLLTPSNEPKQDEWQVFEWMYVGAAYGEMSRELAEAVYKANQEGYAPMERFSNNKVGRMSHRAYTATLLKFGLVKYKFVRNSKDCVIEWIKQREGAKEFTPLSNEEATELYDSEQDKLKEYLERQRDAADERLRKKAEKEAAASAGASSKRGRRGGGAGGGGSSAM